jgi:ferredoxin-thioredoxin reductase catalytic subunit
MKVIVNSDKALVKEVRSALKENGGYCPCALTKTDDTKCMCKAFREQIKDPDFEGFCHCMLYYKTKD